MSFSVLSTGLGNNYHHASLQITENTIIIIVIHVKKTPHFRGSDQLAHFVALC